MVPRPQESNAEADTPDGASPSPVVVDEEANNVVASTTDTPDDGDDNNNEQTKLAEAEETQPSKEEKEAEDQEEEAPPKTCWQRCVDFYFGNEFLILVVCAILLARAYPPLGAEYLAPEITATWIAVIIIFIMAGLGLKTEEFSTALCGRTRFNLLIQSFNFGVVSATVYGVSRALAAGNILSQDLADGLVVGASLPMTINMVFVLTKASGGDESLAIVNAAAGNMIGVFLSPVLILGYLGVTGGVELWEVFYKLALRVVLPVAVGQLMQKKMPKVLAFYKKHKKRFKKLQEYALIFIVYTVFCRTFNSDSNESSVGDIFLAMAFVGIFLVSFMVVAWFMLGVFYSDQPKLRVMGLFGCTHKTVAMGVPLINAIYEGNPSVGSYTLPLLIWHPMQLVLGTFLAPRLVAYVERTERELGINKEDDDEDLEAS